MALKLAIVGRPNVGKSTLFNRLAGRKLAIVDDRPGVTRDRRFATGSLGDLELQLIDTAGFEDVTDESLEARMRIQTERAIDQADVCLFLIDSREGVIPLDEVFAAILRRRNTPVVMVANKAEGKAGDAGAAEAFKLGLGDPIAISAEHGEGMADLYAAVAVYADAAQAVEDEQAESARIEKGAVSGDYGIEGAGLEGEDEDEEAEDKPIRIAVVGRPNAGKSTLVNRLIGEDRMLTGPEAGITRDAISVEWEWEGRRIRLVDTAGMRRKAKVHEKLERLSVQDSIRTITFAEVILLVMDADNAFDTQDLQLADLMEREGRAMVFVIAKWDLVEEPQARLAEIAEKATRLLPQVRGAPLVALSAQTGWGMNRLMPAVLQAHRNWTAKVKTRDLNDWLQIMTQRHPPPAVSGKRIKLKYVAQIKARPPTFVLFATRASQLPESYKRYLVNGLRESFELPGVPIRLNLKSSSNPYGAEGQGGGPKRRLRGAEAFKDKPRKAAAKAARKPAAVPPGAAAPGETAVAVDTAEKPKRKKAPAYKPTTKRAARAHQKPAFKTGQKYGAKKPAAKAAPKRGGAKPTAHAAAKARAKPAGKALTKAGKPKGR